MNLVVYTKWRMLSLLPCFEDITHHIGLKPSPCTDLCIYKMLKYFGTSVNAEWNLSHSTEWNNLPKWKKTFAKFSSQPLLYSHKVPKHSHTNIRAGWFSLLLILRNIISLIRTGILCLELNASSWMSTGLVKHGTDFSFYFPQWTVKCTFNRWCLHDMLSWQNKSNSL